MYRIDISERYRASRRAASRAWPQGGLHPRHPWPPGSRLKGRRLAVSDAIFGFLILNVLVSGIYDLATGINTRVPVPGIHLYIGWHSLSSLLFLGYLITHVIRRWKRLRRSHIR